MMMYMSSVDLCFATSAAEMLFDILCRRMCALREWEVEEILRLGESRGGLEALLAFDAQVVVDGR